MELKEIFLPVWTLFEEFFAVLPQKGNKLEEIFPGGHPFTQDFVFLIVVLESFYVYYDNVNRWKAKFTKAGSVREFVENRVNILADNLKDGLSRVARDILNELLKKVKELPEVFRRILSLDSSFWLNFLNEEPFELYSSLGEGVYTSKVNPSGEGSGSFAGSRNKLGYSDITPEEIVKVSERLFINPYLSYRIQEFFSSGRYLKFPVSQNIEVFEKVNSVWKWLSNRAGLLEEVFINLFKRANDEEKEKILLMLKRNGYRELFDFFVTGFSTGADSIASVIRTKDLGRLCLFFSSENWKFYPWWRHEDELKQMLSEDDWSLVEEHIEELIQPDFNVSKRFDLCVWGVLGIWWSKKKEIILCLEKAS